MGGADRLPNLDKRNSRSASALFPKGMLEAELIMANSFLIVMSIWFAANILFVAWRLWVTRPDSWKMGTGGRHFSPVSVKSQLRCHL
ncbi:hypothetical protein [Bradyrhizobium sp. LB11.1]|uniref:hypothetical protein n=1 Tax=Bradyrhizobium sp. LB11.1 TaxID=3156326 RepID=UPI0033982DF8